MAITRRAVIFDKDGTLVENVPYNIDPRQVRLSLHAAEALRLLQDAGYGLLVASNQSGVARGYFDEAALDVAWQRLEALAWQEGVSLAGFFWCPHHPDGVVPKYSVVCGCRKPAPGLLTRAAAAVGAAPEQCWMVGDILDDVEAGRRGGMRTVLIDNGNETEWQQGELRNPDHIVTDMYEAALAIVRADATAARRSGKSYVEAARW